MSRTRKNERWQEDIDQMRRITRQYRRSQNSETEKRLCRSTYRENYRARSQDCGW
jgi:ribosomal protein L19E